MKHLVFAFLFILISFQFVVSQNTYEISGKIIDESLFGIPLVHVSLNNEKLMITNDNGNFVFEGVSEGEHVLKISSVGYETLIKKLKLNKNTFVKYTLKESFESLSTITISGKKKTATEIIESSALTIESLDIEQVLEKNNDLVGELDKVSGVRIRTSGSVGATSQIALNGLTNTAVRFFVDGIPLNFLYPNIGLGNLPLADIKRVNIYKGILPVNLGIDALGGAVNVITNDKDKNKIKASYSIGSFNTHFGSIYVNLVDKKNNFINVIAGINLSDNNYTFNADIFTAIGQPLTQQKVERFHDAYRLAYTGITVGTKNKKWTDYAQITYNYFDKFKEFNNGARVDEFAIGEAEETAKNYSIVAKYKKAFFNKKLEFDAIANYSKLDYVFKDTTSNRYNWLGDIVSTNNQGEFGAVALNTVDSKNSVVRPSLTYNLNENNKLILSNLTAKKSNDITRLKDGEFEDIPTQTLTKNITGFGIEGFAVHKKLEYFSSIKYYKYTGEVVFQDLNLDKGDDFFGWNVGAKYDVNKHIAIRASYERGFLIPELRQLTGDLALIDPNSLLEPEESDNYNLGLQLNYNKIPNVWANLSVGAFYREQNNRIFLEANGITSQYVNTSGVEVKGVESELMLTFFKNLTFTGNLTLQEIFDLDRDALLPNTPSFFYDVQLNYKNKKLLGKNIPWNVYTSLHYIDVFNHETLGGLDNLQDNPEKYVPEQTQLDLGFSLKILKEKNVTMAFNIRNVLDQEVFDNFDIPKPGRNFNVKVIYELDNFNK